MRVEDGKEVVVLTGSSGCLGHHTLKLLISHDDSVDEIRCLDLTEPQESMKTTIEEELRKSKLKTGKEKRIRWFKGDIRDVNIVEQILNGADCVINCAAKIEVWKEIDEQDKGEFETINVNGTENLLEASIRFGVYKFIHVSSFEVYTMPGAIYYATENTLPEVKWFMFGASGLTKKKAENKVKQYSNNKLKIVKQDSIPGRESLNAIIVRFPTFYGEYDKYFVSRILEVTKFFNGQLRRLDSVWVRQQPIYVGNAAWSLIKAKEKMNFDQSISGEEFHITDDTAIGDPFDFVEPYVECRGMRVTKDSYKSLPIFILLILFFAAAKLLKKLDFLGLFTKKKGRLEEAIERDQAKKDVDTEPSIPTSERKSRPMRWYDYITPQAFGYMCTTTFLNRSKASLRLDYEPLITPEESQRRSIDWYKNHLKI